MERNCGNCGFKTFTNGYYKERLYCGHYTGPRSGRSVSPSGCCDLHATPDEKIAGSIIHTSVDDARYAIDGAPIEALKIALALEVKGSNRSSLIKKLQSRIKKLEKSK